MVGAAPIRTVELMNSSMLTDSARSAGSVWAPGSSVRPSGESRCADGRAWGADDSVAAIEVGQ